MTPLKSIRKHCLWCMNGQAPEVRLCPSTDCPLYFFRFNKREKGGSTLKAIRQRCKGCGGGTAFAIKNCEFPDCPLYVYRFGKNPAFKGRKVSPETRKKGLEALKKYRKKKRLEAQGLQLPEKRVNALDRVV